MRLSPKLHFHYRAAAMRAAQRTTLCICGLVSFILIGAAAVALVAPGPAIFCAMAAVLCGFGVWVHATDHRECARRA